LKHKNSIESLLVKALVEKDKKNFNKSKRIFNKILSITDSLEARHHLVEIYLLEKEYILSKLYVQTLIANGYKLADNLNKLGVIFSSERNFSEAILLFKKSLNIFSGNLIVQKNLAYNFRLNYQYSDAEQIYKDILYRYPKDIDNLCNISNLYFTLGKTFLGFKFLLKAYKIDKKSFKTIINLVARLPYIKIKSKKNLLFLEKIVPKKNLFKTEGATIDFKSIKNYNTNNDKCLKLGFISNDFFSHPVGYYLFDFLKILKKQNVEIIIFSDKKNTDNYTKEIKKNSHKWIDTYSLKNFSVAEKIKRNELDLLFDLSGITNSQRRDLYVHKLALKTISWMGWLASTGIPNIDHIYGDKYATPDDDQPKFTEKLINKNSIWCCLSTSDIRKVNQKVNLNEKYFVFAMFQNPLKMSNILIKTWSEILNKTTNTKILFANRLYESDLIKNRILKLFSHYKVNINRIEFSKQMKRNEVLECYNNTDAVLDTFPYNGGTSSFEASFMGVPIITLNDPKHIMFRCGSSINCNLELEKFIAKNESEYVSKAILLAEKKDPIFRKELIERNRNSNLFNMENFVMNFYENCLNLS
jgi:protein O-GlcNAc transferase